MAKSLTSRTVVLVLALLVVLGTVAILGLGPSQSDPFHAPSIDNQVHSIAPNADTWFQLNYGSTNSTLPVVTLRLVNGTQSGVGFEVWSPENINGWWENKPTGRGTAAPIDCDTGQVSGGGGCRSNDLTWSGAFGLAGTYYVHVINTTSSAKTFQLTIEGIAVPSGTPAPAAPIIPSTPAPAPSLPAQAPPASAQAAAVDDPNRAVPIDGQMHTLPANSATWYRFDYGGTDLVPHPIVYLRLVNGVVSGVRFEVWSGENLQGWWENHPVGRGTQEVLVNCFGTAPEATPTVEGETPTPTPEPTFTPTAKCPTNDLTWAGAFGAPGTFYLRVVNDTGNAANYVLIKQ